MWVLRILRNVTMMSINFDQRHIEMELTLINKLKKRRILKNKF